MIKINIAEIKVTTLIGTKPEERTTPQDILITVCYNYNAQEAIEKDDLCFAVDYEKLVNTIKKRVEKSSFYLIETLADFILKIVFEEKNVQSATVDIKKLKALKDGAFVGTSVGASKQ